MFVANPHIPLFYEQDIMYNFKYIFINILLCIILYKLINVHMYNNCCNIIATAIAIDALSFTLTLIYKINRY